MVLQFQHIEPHCFLKNFIAKMWLFESSGKIPAKDLKLVVPNGNLKLTVSFRNGINADIEGNTFLSREQDITLAGLINVPVILDVEKDVKTETIGVEFNPQNAYRFFRINLHDIQNKIYSIKDILGVSGKYLIEQMNNTQTVEQKTELLQQFLIKQLSTSNEDMIFEYCVNKIVVTKGLITVKELESKTGYSSRWLNTKFNEKLGLGPKAFSSIIRFKNYYQSLVNCNPNKFSKKDYYELYYDQAHFIRTFEHFTGLPPSFFEKQINDFGKKYYIA